MNLCGKKKIYTYFFLEMAPLAYLLVLMSIAHGIGLTDAYPKYYYRTMEKKNCDYPGYAPDGFRTEITSISPIQVEAPASALAKIAGAGATGNFCFSEFILNLVYLQTHGKYFTTYSNFEIEIG